MDKRNEQRGSAVNGTTRPQISHHQTLKKVRSDFNLTHEQPAHPLAIEKSSVPAHALFNQDGLLINYSDSFQNVFQIVSDLITPGVGFATLMDAVVHKAGEYLSDKERADWRQKLRQYQRGPNGFQRDTVTNFDFMGLGFLHLRSQRQELHDGAQLYSFDASPVLPSALGEIMHLNRQVLAAMEDINEGFILYDDKGKMIYCNARHRELYPDIAHLMTPGVDRHDVLESHWEETEDNASKIYNGTHNDNQPDQIQADQERRLPNGQWIKISEKPTQSGGIVAVRTEITDLKDHQSALSKVNDRLIVQAEELESVSAAAKQATAAKSDFLATMSHEIRTPLNGVIGMAQLLSGTQLDDEQQCKLDIIINSGKNLLEIINDILDMSKIEAGSVELEFTSFDLPALLESAFSPFQIRAEDYGLTLQTNIENCTVKYINSDSMRLRQILTNLVGNAVKFTLSGSITLSLEELSEDDPRCQGLVFPGEEISGEALEETPVKAASKTLLIAVTDTGTGISEDRLESIFSAFTQEDNSITRKFGGTGLGLSIVKNLVEMLGGTIKAHSKVNTGSRFEIILPCRLPDDKDLERLQAMGNSLEKLDCPPLNVILAEDNMVNAMIASAFLEKFGHSVKHANNGIQAIAALEKEDIDLIFMDIHMPQMDGMEATIEIRKGDTRPDIPIIGLTAEAFSERHAHFRDIGMNDVISKPFTEEQLKETILKNFELVEKERAKTNQETRTRENAALYSPKSITESTIESSAENSTETQETATPNQTSTKTSTSTDNLEALKNVSVTNHNDEHPVGSEEQLAEMRSQIGGEVLAELLGMAPETVNSQIQNLNAGLESKDSEAIYLAAHTIKGIAGSMFATRLANQALKMEQLSKDFPAAQEFISTLEQAASETIAWWESKMV